MDNKKNIDRLFQEKFKDFEVAPNDAVWSRISESLPDKKRKRRVIALWWQIGGVAAVIAILLTIGVSVFDSDDNNNQAFPVVNTEDKSNDTNKKNADSFTEDEKGNEVDELEFVDSDKGKEPILDEKESNNSPSTKKSKLSHPLTSSNKSESNAVVNNSNKNERVQPSQKLHNLKTILNKKNTVKVAENKNNIEAGSKQPEKTKLASESQLNSIINKTIENNKTAIVDNKTESESSKNENSELKNTNVETVIVEDLKKESIIEAIAENTDEVDEKEEDEQNRWSIAPNVAPVYYSSLGQGSSLDQQFNNNAKSSDINMSYGITGAYAVSKKLKIRAGINRLNLNQTTSNVFAFTGSETASRGPQVEQQSSKNINLKNDLPNVLLMSSAMLNGSSAPELFNTKIAGDIDQRIGFIEVPLELEYRLLDEKFGVNVIGGFSTFFLNQNEIYADVEGTSTLIGEANNINSTSFSANLGLGIDYSLSKQWNINLEPQFKYQINTFNNTSGNFRPFIIGVYTGLSFKF